MKNKIAPIVAHFISSIILRLAMLLGALAYLRTLSFSFVLDDFGIIVINPWLESWRFVPRFFTTHVWASLGGSGAGSYYRPLFLMWLGLNRHLFGLTPAWWHLAAVSAHLFCTYLVYQLAKRILRHDGHARDEHVNAHLTASAAALVFAVYPLHIEAVAWVSGSSELLLAITFLASFIFYLDWQDLRDRHSRLVLSLAFYALAILAKETAIVLPALVFAHCWIFAPTQRSNSSSHSAARTARAILAASPYLLLTLAYAALRVFIVHIPTPESTAPLRAVLLSLPAAGFFYIKHLLWPFRLSYLYDFDLITLPSAQNFGWPLLALTTVILAFWFLLRDSRPARFLLCWMALLIVPAIAALLVFSRHDYVHDRYLYLPSVGFCILLASLLKGILLLSRATSRLWTSVPIAALALSAVFAVSTFRQTAHWDNDIALLTWACERAPHNPLPRQLLAESFLADGNSSAALDSYRRALSLDPDSSVVNGRTAMAYVRNGQFPEAQQHLIRAIELRRSKGLPDEPDYFYYLGLIYLQQGNFDFADSALRRAIQLQPYGLGYHAALASLLTKKGDLTAAQAETRAELASRAEYTAAAQRLLQP